MHFVTFCRHVYALSQPLPRMCVHVCDGLLCLALNPPSYVTGSFDILIDLLTLLNCYHRNSQQSGMLKMHYRPAYLQLYHVSGPTNVRKVGSARIFIIDVNDKFGSLEFFATTKQHRTKQRLHAWSCFFPDHVGAWPCCPC